MSIFALGGDAAAGDSSGWIAAADFQCSCINVYSAAGHGQQLKSQLNAQDVFGLSVSRDRTLYAGQTLSDGSFGIAVYPPESKIPAQESDVPDPQGAAALAVRPDGTLYVGSETGILYMYLPHTTKPAASLLVNPRPYMSVQSIALDPRTGDVYMSVAKEGGHRYYSVLYRVSADLNSFSVFFSPPFLATLSLAVDSQSNLIVGLRHGIGVYPPGATKPARFFGQNSAVTAITYDSAHDLLYAASAGAGGINAYRYSTGRIVDDITSGWGPSSVPTSIALDPAQP